MFAPWRSPLDHALHCNSSIPSARFAQLATLRLDGRPANRTVVFRGFWAETDDLEFITDSRSAKVEQVAHCPAAELCWYFAHTREQFRLQGELVLITAQTQSPLAQAERLRLWQVLSDSTRLQFCWPTPGAVPESAVTAPLPDPQYPLESFVLLVLQPWQVDHLDLGGEPHNRWLYQRQTPSQTWQYQAINP